MAAGVAITRSELDAAGLRRAASRSRDADATRRMLALALVLEGRTRSEAAKLCGMDRQTLRDWVHRYNEQGLPGLSDRVPPGAKPRLSPEQTEAVARLVREGPTASEHGVVRWRRVDLSRVIKRRFGVDLAERSVGDLLRRLGFRRLSARPRHPGHDAAAQEAHKNVPVYPLSSAGFRSSTSGVNLGEFEESVRHWWGTEGGPGQARQHGGEVVSAVEAVLELGEVAWHVLLMDRPMGSHQGRLDVAEGGVDPLERRGAG